MTKQSAVQHGPWEVLVPGTGRVSESPRWSAVARRWSWVDIERGEVHTVAAGGGHRVLRLEPPVGAAVPDPVSGDVVVAQGCRLLRLGAGGLEPWVDLPEPGSMRLNDAGVDPHGRLWTSSLARDYRGRCGRLYRIDRDGSWSIHRWGVGIGNGLAWDGGRMFFVDSARRCLHALPWDGQRITGRARVWFRPPQGMPDGIFLDGEGGLWVACFWGACLHRLDGQGRCIQTVPLPVSVSAVTACWIGGPEGDQLVVTTAWEHGDSLPSARPELAGAVLTCRLGRPLAPAII